MEQSKNSKYDVFVSHSSEDTDYCYELTETLEKEKFKCFMYERDLIGNLMTEIVNNIKDSRRVLLVITPSFLKSQWGVFEAQEAIRKCHEEKVVAVIPILHEVEPDQCPHYLKPYRYYETKEKDFLENLKQAIREDRSTTTLIPAGDVAHGLCWSYYYGYLKLVLPGMVDRCKHWLKEQSQVGLFSSIMQYIGLTSRPEAPKMLKKMIIIIPHTCYCPKSLVDFDKDHFEHVGFIDYSATRAGNIKRDYKSSVFKVKDPKTNEEFLFIGEFATPLLSMYEMEQSQIAGLGKEELIHQRMLFAEKLRDILWHPSNQDCHHKATILQYSNETEEKAKELAAVLCQHIRTELGEESRMAELHQDMEKLTTHEKTSHD